jgi:hydroxypyruvate reductase
MNPRELLLACFHAALSAADTSRLLPPHLPAQPAGRTLVVGGGKAAAAMARAVEDHWPTNAPLTGLVVTRYQHGLPSARIEVMEASHPLPDGRGAQAATRMLDMIAELNADDLLLVLLSGGGSSLLALPVEGVTLKALRAVTKGLLASGARIADINTVRKHLTRFSAGQVARAPCPTLALLLSDVVGDDPMHIASGPCAPDLTTFCDALEILDRFGVVAPPAVRAHLERGEIPDTPKPGDACFARVENRVIGSARGSLDAAAGRLRDTGITVEVLGELEGDAHRLAREHAARLCQTPGRPIALVSGGEAAVEVRGAGRGGRNTEFLLALALELQSAPGVWALAADTDGIDGEGGHAGAIITPDTLARAHALGLDAASYLANNDSANLFDRLGDLIVTGPTRTNVNDLRIVLAV